MKKHQKNKRLLLIDADPLVYQAGLSVEKAVEWESDLWTVHADLGEAKRLIDSKISHYMNALKGDDFILALSCPTEEGFRRKVCPEYKSNRAGARKPVIHAAIRGWLINDCEAIQWPRLEADDVLGIFATAASVKAAERGLDFTERIIVSIDKDFRTIPGLFYRTTGDEPEIEEITPESAARFHLVQTLTGDAVDGYKGLPGVGPVKAEKILAEDCSWKAVVAAYQKAGLSETVALTNARLAYILRDGDYNLQTQKVKAWKP